MRLKIFYDGLCPLCVAEMRKLAALDQHSALELIDIQQAGFQQAYPGLDWQALNAAIHAQLPDGSIIIGLDATYMAWKTVGKGWIYAPLRWPIIGWFADKFYRFFARNRYTISYLLTGKKRCDKCEPLAEKTLADTNDN